MIKKRTVRKCIFETNSSSMHTLTMVGNRSNINKYYNLNGVIMVSIGDYGWYGDPCDDFYSKLAYGMCMVLLTEYPGFWDGDEDFVIEQSVLESLPGYKLLLKAIQLHGDCDKIIIKRRGNPYHPYGYIDHQSYENYSCLKDFLDDWDVDAERFLFDDDVIILIENDN